MGTGQPLPHLVAEDLVQGGPGAAQGAEEGEPEAERAVVGGLQQHHLRHDQRRVPHVAAELRRHLTADGAAGRRRAAPRSGREDPGWGPRGGLLLARPRGLCSRGSEARGELPGSDPCLLFPPARCPPVPVSACGPGAVDVCAGSTFVAQGCSCGLVFWEGFRR